MPKFYITDDATATYQKIKDAETAAIAICDLLYSKELVATGMGFTVSERGFDLHQDDLHFTDEHILDLYDSIYGV